jgi:hypothetical protein
MFSLVRHSERNMERRTNRGLGSLPQARIPPFERRSELIVEYLEVFHDRQRHQSTLGYRFPAEFEAKAAVA